MAVAANLEKQITKQTQQAAVFVKAWAMKKIKLKNNNDANASHTQNQNTQHHKRRTNNNKETRNTTNEKQTTTKEQTQNPCMKVMQKAESALRVAARVSRSACQTFEDTVTSI